MEDIRRLPQATPRVETGPVMFGNDWPGLFIRGDNAAYYALILDSILKCEGIHAIGPIAYIQLSALHDLLREPVITSAYPIESKPQG